MDGHSEPFEILISEVSGLLILNLLTVSVSHYFQMLVVMTFNVELFAAVVLGVGLGHFITNITENSFEEDEDENVPSAAKRGSIPGRRDDAYLHDCCN